MANAPLLDYIQLAKRFYADFNSYSQIQIESVLYQNSDKVNTTYLKANLGSLDDVVFGLQQAGYADKAAALKITIENLSKVVKTHDKGETTGPRVLVNVAHILKELKALCRPIVPKKPLDMPSMTPESRVLAVYADNPDLNMTEIATKAGVSRTSLYRMKKFRTVKKMFEAEEATSYKNAIPVGEKDGETGELKAWEK